MRIFAAVLMAFALIALGAVAAPYVALASPAGVDPLRALESWQSLNVLVSSAVLVYVVKNEHRLTTLEVTLSNLHPKGGKHAVPD